MNEQAPLPIGVAFKAVARCVIATAVLLARGSVRQPASHVGMRLRFADGTSARVYRETTIRGVTAEEPCLLVVEFRLRFVRGRLHTLFRLESLLNTPLFVGFPGFVSKLWVTHDENGVYRGVYEWDGAVRAEHYARSLWLVLALVSVRGSIHYQVVPGLHRDEVLAIPQILDGEATGDSTAWWRLVEAA